MARPKMKRGPGRPKMSATAGRRGRPAGAKNKVTRTRTTVDQQVAAAMPASENAPIVNLSMKMLELYQRIDAMERALAGQINYVQGMANNINQAFKNVEAAIYEIRNPEISVERAAKAASLQKASEEIAASMAKTAGCVSAPSLFSSAKEECDVEAPKKRRGRPSKVEAPDTASKANGSTHPIDELYPDDESDIDEMLV